MEFILDKKNWGGFFVKLQRKIAVRFFLASKRKSRLYFVVMGDSILFHIRQTVSPELAERFISVDHSYIFGSTRPRVEVNKPLQIGTVGVLTEAKGYDTLCVLAERLQAMKKVKLTVTGRIFADIEPLERFGVDLPCNKGIAPLEDEEFRERIERLDYILFLYPTDSYRMIASGAVMDAVDKARPIVSLRNDYFSYLFNKYGNFGFLAEDTSHLLHLIEQLGQGELQCSAIDFDELRHKMSPEVLCAELKTALSTINWL
ncbi:MAG: hypothetical protein K2G93_00945 [Rikenella sp.]|nr:hypothetical protein [Rikenella sp.]